MVGQRSLEPYVEVRILSPQPQEDQLFSWFFYLRSTNGDNLSITLSKNELS